MVAGLSLDAVMTQGSWLARSGNPRASFVAVLRPISVLAAALTAAALATPGELRVVATKKRCRSARTKLDR